MKFTALVRKSIMELQGNKVKEIKDCFTYIEASNVVPLKKTTHKDKLTNSIIESIVTKKVNIGSGYNPHLITIEFNHTK